MVSVVVYATDSEDGGKRSGGNGNSDGGNNKGIDSRYGHDSGEGNGHDSNTNEIGTGMRNGGNGNEGKGNDNGRKGNDNGGKGNERAIMVKEGHDQTSISDIGSKTVVVQHTISMHVVQASVIVLLVSYSTEVAPSISAAWWSLVESNAEQLFRKFFFLAGSVGERIRRKNVLRNRKRREIYLFIVNNPFSHFRRITRMAGVGPNEGSWHLRILEKMGLIASEYVGRYLTYHAKNSGHICSRDDQPICLIPNSNATKILEYLLRNPGVKIAHLTQALMINRNTISYHVKRMQTSGLVERVGRNGLRLSPINRREELADFIANPSLQEVDVL